MWKGAKTGLERGKKWFGTGAKTSFKRHKKRNLAKFYNLERRGTTVLCRSTSFHRFFSLFQPFFHPFLTLFAKNGKKGRQKMEERERKERVPFQFLSSSRFFPFLSRNISTLRPAATSYSTAFTQELVAPSTLMATISSQSDGEYHINCLYRSIWVSHTWTLGCPFPEYLGGVSILT